MSVTEQLPQDKQSKRIVAGHQPHYFPWLGYFNKIYLADAFCIVDTIQYRKKYFQNRTKIKTKNGPLWLTIPVKTRGFYKQNIDEVEIDNTIPWQRKHWRTLQLAYKKAPYFQRYSDFFQEIYEKRKWEKLVEINEYSLFQVLNFLGLDKEIIKSSSFNPTGKKTNLLIDICKAMKADGYLSGMGGAREYVDLEKLKKQNLEHYFQKFMHPKYPQLHGEFIPQLSIIDLLFNCGPTSLDYIKGGEYTI